MPNFVVLCDKISKNIILNNKFFLSWINYIPRKPKFTKYNRLRALFVTNSTKYLDACGISHGILH